MSENGSTPTIKRTLGLTGITVNAMALIAPGAFLWMTYQLQAASVDAGGVSTAKDMWAGIVTALFVAFLTAFAFAELARRYPEAGNGSAYYFAEKAFLDRAEPAHRRWARLAKFVTGWAAHLFYWVYPGVMVAFFAVLVSYIAGALGFPLNLPAQILVACGFSALVGFIALRGISGSTMAAVAINVIQLFSLVVLSVLAILYRVKNPAGLAPADWYHPSALSIILPHNFSGMLFQSTIAILILVGFESSTALAAEAKNPRRDIPRGVILSLVIQGLFAYLLEYFAANYALGASLTATTASGTVSGIAAAASSGAPIGDLAVLVGNAFLGGNGFAFMLLIASTVAIAILGTTLAAMNTGVRISFAMALDEEMPEVMGLLHRRYATPYAGVVAMVVVSAVIGVLGVAGGVVALTGITLASNLGTFVLYALICGLTVVAFQGRREFSFIRHGAIPLLGVVANVVMVLAIFVIGLISGGSTTQATLLAIGISAAWLAASVAYFVVNSRRKGIDVFPSAGAVVTRN